MKRTAALLIAIAFAVVGASGQINLAGNAVVTGGPASVTGCPGNGDGM